MALPFFYIENYVGQQSLVLSEDTSKHIIQVLRMKKEERLNLADGKGNIMTCSIIEEHKKHCTVSVIDTLYEPPPARKVTIAISLIKNANRFEWFLEKATELGVTGIIPLVCERTEKEKFRFDRMQGICISAMLQSQQARLPVLQEPVQFENIEMWKCGNGTNFIAHCIDGDKKSLTNFPLSANADLLLCIGPEGDFTSKEIEMALQQQFIPVGLGATRLRTETAGVVAAALLLNYSS